MIYKYTLSLKSLAFGSCRSPPPARAKALYKVQANETFKHVTVMKSTDRFRSFRLSCKYPAICDRQLHFFREIGSYISLH